MRDEKIQSIYRTTHFFRIAKVQKMFLKHQYHSTMIITDDTINNYIKMLDDRFDLLMTLEHLDESLLLLQHDLCWEPHDIYYLNRMVSKSNR